MNHVWPADTEHFFHIGKALRDAKSFTELSGHERLLIAESDDAATGDSTNRLDMLVCNLTATDQRDPQGRGS
jgi:hypothetical protein